MARLSPLASVSATRAVLEEHGLSTKRSLGQNFLVNDDILRKIVELAQLEPGDFVLEVGPGIGTLTVALLKCAGAVVSVERDPDLPAVLAETLSPWRERFALIEKDALDLTPEDLDHAKQGLDSVGQGLCPCRSSEDACGNMDEGADRDMPADCGKGRALALLHRSRCNPQTCFPDVPLETVSVQQGPACQTVRQMTPSFSTDDPNKLVANLPYAVAATVVLDYFQRFSSLESATVMVQREVADRMAAAPGSKNYGAYTVKLRLLAEPAGRFAVGPGNFFPPPHVESAVLRLNRCPLCDDAGRPLDTQDLEATCIMADAAFTSRRKTLANSCKAYFAARGTSTPLAPAALPGLFEQADIDPARRGETLDLQEFIRLGKALRKMSSF